MSRVYFFAGPEDTRSLAHFFIGKKLHLVSTRFDDDRDVQQDDLIDQPGCYVSPVPLGELMRSEAQALATDPLIRDSIHPCRQPVVSWRRSCVDGPYLIAGELEWEKWVEGLSAYPDDARLRQLNAEIGKGFRAARRWIHASWTQMNGFWFGPEAARLRDLGSTAVSFHPEKVALSNVLRTDA